MKHIEDCFGVPLFNRGKNKIELNETGKVAVEYARKLLFEVDNTIQVVQAFDKNLRNISIESCAPAPLWKILLLLSKKYPNNSISSKIIEINEIIKDVLNGQCDIGIIPFELCDKRILDFEYIKENLFICVPDNNPLAKKKEVTFDELNGFNCLLRDEIGFWTDLCYKKMPASKFLIQTDESEFRELVKASTLFCFATDVASYYNDFCHDRVEIPIADNDVHVTYHLICKPEKKDLIQKISP